MYANTGQSHTLCLTLTDLFGVNRWGWTWHKGDIRDHRSAETVVVSCLPCFESVHDAEVDAWKHIPDGYCSPSQK